MKTRYWIVGTLIAIGGLIVGGQLLAGKTDPVIPPSAATGTSIVLEPFRANGLDSTPRLDNQGTVEVQITPINLESPEAELRFEVILDTHSVDLTMDLGPLAALSTDNGLILPHGLWDAPLGGHHVTGTLRFALDPEQITLLQSASQLTLEITDLVVPVRSFVWEKLDD